MGVLLFQRTDIIKKSSLNLYKKMGVGMAKRAAASMLKPEITFNITSDGFHFINKSLTTTENTYKWGVPTDDLDPTGAPGKQVWNMDDEDMQGTFTYNDTSKPSGEVHRTIRNGKIVQTFIVDGEACVRVFKKC